MEDKWINSMERSMDKAFNEIAILKGLPGDFQDRVNQAKLELQQAVATAMTQMREELRGQLRDEFRREFANLTAQMRAETDVTRQQQRFPADDRQMQPKSYIKKPPKYQEGDDPEIFMIQFNLACDGKNWDHGMKLKFLPQSFPLSVLPWYISLPEITRNNYDFLVDAFKQRFNLTVDLHQLEQTFHNLKATAFKNLDLYACKVQGLGLKLNKSIAEMLAQFKLGLNEGTYRWVVARNPRTIEDALKHAIDFEAMFKGQSQNNAVQKQKFNGNSIFHNQTRVDNNIAPVSQNYRQDEPMEHAQRGSPRYTNNRPTHVTNQDKSRWRKYGSGHGKDATKLNAMKVENNYQHDSVHDYWPSYGYGHSLETEDYMSDSLFQAKPSKM